jgi:hypothetical protein
VIGQEGANLVVERHRIHIAFWVQIALHQTGLAMTFRKFEGPWDGAELLGCRNLFCGDRLILDLFEYLQNGPDQDVTTESETISEGHTIGLTGGSRIWRLSFDRPFAVRAHDHNLKMKHESRSSFPSRCCFSERSEWIDEFIFSQSLQFFTPTHYVFDLLNNFIEIMGDDAPTVEEIANEIGFQSL